MKMKRLTALMLAGCLMVSTMMTGCGNRIDQKAVAATLGDKEISLGLANFMAQYQAITYDAYYMSYYGEDMWKTDVSGDGTTMTEQVKSQIMDQIETSYLLEQHMSDYKVEITDEDLNKIKDAAKEFIADNKGDAADTMGATEEYVTEMLRLELIQKRMQSAIEAEVNPNVTDDEAAQRTFSYIHVDADGYYDEKNQYIKYTDEEKKKLPDKVEKMAADAKTDFDGAAKNNDYKVATYSYGKDSDEDSMDKAVITAADALKKGEISDLIKTDSKGYYVIRLDSEFDKEATDKKKESIISQKKSEHYTEVTDGYKKDAKWKVNDDDWKTVNFDQLYQIKKEDSTENAGTEAVVDTEAIDGTEAALNTEN